MGGGGSLVGAVWVWVLTLGVDSGVEVKTAKMRTSPWLKSLSAQDLHTVLRA